MIWCRVAIGLLWLVGLSQLGAAQETAWPESTQLRSWLSGPTATGNWGGTRDALQEKGFTVTSNFTTDLSVNPAGGELNGSAYAGNLFAGVALDLEKLAGIKGSSLNASGAWASGRSLSEKDIGNLFVVQEVWGPGSFYLGQLSLSQSVFNNALVLEAG